MSKKIKVGIIGCGKIAQIYAGQEQQSHKYKHEHERGTDVAPNFLNFYASIV